MAIILNWTLLLAAAALVSGETDGCAAGQCEDAGIAVELLQLSLETGDLSIGSTTDVSDGGADGGNQVAKSEAVAIAGASSSTLTSCPSDGYLAAKIAWEDFFASTCKVASEDVPQSLKDIFEQSRSFSELKASTCKVFLPYRAHTDYEFQLTVEIRPGDNPTDQNWESVAGSESVSLIGTPLGSVTKEKACEYLFEAGVPRLAFMPEFRVQEVFQQVQVDFERACRAKQLSRYQLSLGSDISSGLTVKRTMTNGDGMAEFVVDLTVNPGDAGEPTDLKVYVEEYPPSDEDSQNDAETQFENAMEQQTEAKAEALLQMGKPDVTEAIQDSETYDEFLADEAAHQKDGGNATPPPLPPQGPREPPIGRLRVLDDRTLPFLCCLCGACDDASVCQDALDGGTPPSFLSEEHLIIPAPEGNPPMPALGSEAEARPPPRPPHPTEVEQKVHRPRFRAKPGYGDNFFSTILKQRTAEDHRRVWAQSRSLVHTVREEGIEVPDEYHFFDDDKRAKCWRPAYSQGECGSCWSFASLGALEKQICMRSGGTYAPSLSREMLVRCSEQNNACEGGNADKAYEDLMEIGGVWNTDCLPYQGKGVKHCPAFSYSWFGQGSTGKTGQLARIDQEMQASCEDLSRYTNRPPLGREWDMPFNLMYESRFERMPNMSDPRLQRFKRGFAKSRSHDRVPSWWLYGEEAMKAAIVKYGSIYASYIAMNDFKNRECNTGCWPPGTVWGEEAEFRPSDCGCPKNGHAVHIIGYGTDIQETGTRVPYWLIENSWGTEIHGDASGEDSQGVKSFGKDPFTELHPMGIEDKCVLAGWYASTLPRTGGCSGNANVNIRDDLEITGGEPDGFELAVKIGDEVVLTKAVDKDSSGMFTTTVSLAPGDHTVKFMVYSKNHPMQQGIHLEKYFISASSLRCRGRGFVYSFTKNDTKATASWGRATRAELKEQADRLLAANGIDVSKKLEGCPSKCRTGRYSEVKPCEGLLVNWGSCYTDSYVWGHSWYNDRKEADCRNCTKTALARHAEALAVKNLPNATFIQWHGLVQQVTGYDEGLYPRYGPYNKRSFGAVSFATIENDGCGPGSECTDNKCVEADPGSFTVKSGACALSDNGACVTSPNYPSYYSKSQACRIEGPDSSVRVSYFNTERNYDKLIVNGVTRHGSYSAGTVWPSNGELSWSSDYSVQRKGWKICVNHASLAQQSLEEPDNGPDEVDEQKAIRERP